MMSNLSNIYRKVIHRGNECRHVSLHTTILAESASGEQGFTKCIVVLEGRESTKQTDAHALKQNEM
jgi:hypothetical protein